MLIDLAQLKATAPDIYADLSPFASRPNSTATEDFPRLSKYMRERLEEWEKSLYRRVPRPQPAESKPAATTAEPAEPPIKQTFENDLRRAADDSKRIRHEKEARARLQQYVTEGGLIDNQANADAISKFIETHPQIRGYWSSAAIDVACDFLGRKGSNTLQWQPPTPAAPPQPVATVRLLPNGEPELSLDAGESQMRAASKEQLKDLSRRRGEGRQQHLGSFSSRF